MSCARSSLSLHHKGYNLHHWVLRKQKGDSMKQTKHSVTTQLGLALESPQPHPLTEEIHEDLIKVLAELLLEAYGDDPSNEQW
jgi:hypothetical protein